MITRRLLLCAALTCTASPIAGQDHAQSYPQRTIKLVVPTGPGGPNDIIARLAAQRLQATLGQSVIVENNPTGGGIVAARMAARAAPDGYTLFFGNTTTFAIIPAISKNPGYDPHQHFAPIAKIADTFQVLVVERDDALKSVRDVIAGAKAKPGHLNFGAVYGTLPHLATELLKSRAGIDVVTVPYKTEPENSYGDFGQAGSVVLPECNERPSAC